MPAEKTVFATAVGSISLHGQTITHWKDRVEITKTGSKDPIATLRPVDNGNAIIIKNEFGVESKPMASIPQINRSLAMMGVTLDKSTEVASSAKEVPGPREMN
jgi:hypothetical protein